MTGLRRLFALSLAALPGFAASPSGLMRPPTPHVDVRQPPAGEATGTPSTASSLPSPIRRPAVPRSLGWQMGPQVGRGVAFKDTMNSAGENLFIGYAGYRVDLASAEAWVDALHEASLAGRGVRYLWAVQGPNDRIYANLEIGNSKIVTTMLPLVGPRTRFILVAGHSSGSFVAHELLGRLAGGMDPDGITAGRVVYFNLDGGASGLTTPAVGRLRRAYFIAAHDGKTGTDSPRMSAMRSLGATYASAGGYWQVDASDSGCLEGAQWCVHEALMTTHSWIDAKASDAGLD